MVVSLRINAIHAIFSAHTSVFVLLIEQSRPHPRLTILVALTSELALFFAFDNTKIDPIWTISFITTSSITVGIHLDDPVVLPLCFTAC